MLSGSLVALLCEQVDEIKQTVRFVRQVRQYVGQDLPVGVWTLTPDAIEALKFVLQLKDLTPLKRWLGRETSQFWRSAPSRDRRVRTTTRLPLDASRLQSHHAPAISSTNRPKRNSPRWSKIG